MPLPKSKTHRRASGSRTSGRRSTAAATRSRRSRATASRSSATIFRDGHEVLGAAVRFKRPGAARWRESPLEPLGNDRFDGLVRGRRAGPLAVPRRGLGRPPRLVAARAAAQGRGRPGGPRERARRGRAAPRRRVAHASRRRSPATAGDRSDEDPLAAPLEVDVDRELGAFGAWYELFPRSLGGFARRRAGAAAARRARLRRRLPAADPPDRRRRTARAATTRSTAEPGDPGSPWAIGAEEGGHDAIHPELGTLEDFERLVARGARGRLRDRARLRDPVLARPPVARRSIRSGSTAAPTGRSSTPRTRPRSYQDIYNVNFGTRGLARALGGAARRRPLLGRAAACGSSASTTRTRSRCRSGSG